MTAPATVAEPMFSEDDVLAHWPAISRQRLREARIAARKINR